MRLYQNDKTEAASIIAWTERRLEHLTDASMVGIYINQFKKMWKESFGTLDDVPQEFKDKINILYNDLKEVRDQNVQLAQTKTNEELHRSSTHSCHI